MKNFNFTFGISLFLLGILLSACSLNSQPIDYGKDACHFCQMTIVDQIHGAEIISDKGKIFKFDAAECLIRHKNSLDNIEGFQFLTNHYETPGEFIKISEAKFLISENLPSPMGAYLTAFKTEEAVTKLQEEKGGKIYNWSELKESLFN